MSRRLIEEWLPIAALGVESVRERTPMTPYPAPNRLHVWWARRPLVASRAAVLASVLPADADREKFVHALGIHGDPVAARRIIDRARRTGKREANPYGYDRAFSYTPGADERTWLATEARRSGLVSPTLLDPTAGGGSIPFEGLRLGLPTTANDLNAVASLVLQATVEWPARFSLDVANEFDRLATRWRLEMQARLAPFFPQPSADEFPITYLWARTIVCPYCDGLIPLSPNWRLDAEGTGVRLLPDTTPGKRRCGFEVVRSVAEQSTGTIDDGDAKCPYSDCGRIVDGTVVKAQAQAGRMGEQLYTVVFKRRIEKKTKTGRTRESWERDFRPPQPEDDVSKLVANRLAEKLAEWDALDIVPSESVPDVMNDDRPRQYGMPRWRDFFSPRQLLCHGEAVGFFRELLDHLIITSGDERSEARRAAFGYLALSLDKLRDYNSRMTRWHSGREVVANTFDRHDFAFKSSYAEMALLVPGMGFDWAIGQTAKCIEELVTLTRPDVDVRPRRRNAKQAALPSVTTFSPPPVTITCKPGDALDHVAPASVDVVVMDPPYGANVMYAELSDFFYVWLKRTAGYVYPDLFRAKLTDKENEAVANVAKFRGQDGAARLANRDYEERMAGIFAECRRVLKADGIMTVMFTHKDTGAWDALTKGLMAAGFVITASWPINTEAEGSLHIKDKAAANSTIFLVCRPRPPADPTAEPVYWEDVVPRVRAAVRGRIADFHQAGMSRLDLYLSSFGPALEEFSRHWPLKRGQPRPQPLARKRRRQAVLFDDWDPYAATPEDALDEARGEVKHWRLEQISHHRRQVQLDKLTEWFVLAWDAFEAPEFPYDEALRLARVVGLDLDDDIVGKLAKKDASDLILWDSAERVARGAIGPADGSRGMIDALHHAAHIGRTRDAGAARDFVERAGVHKDPLFLQSLEAVLEVLPVSRAFSGIDLPTAAAPAGNDFEALENLRRLAFSGEVERPRQLELYKEESE